MTRKLTILLAALASLLTAHGQEPKAKPAQDRFVAPNQFKDINQLRPGRGIPRAGRAAIHEPFTPPVTAAKIRTAIDDAVFFLRSQQGPEGNIGDEGTTCLAALTLLAAGSDPSADDGLQKAMDWLAKQKPNNTYMRGLRANVWEYAWRKVPDERYRKLLKEEYDWLLAALGNREGWRYTMESTDWDNSCTQYGVLGLWAAARAGFDPGDKFWITLSKHFRSCQGGDGGWSYITGASSPNMATAGLASMFLVFDMYHGKTPYSKANPRTFTTGDAAEVLKSIDRGMEWLGKAQGAKEDGYYLYGIERTGVASGRKLIGGEDWFARGALAVLQNQQRDGSIPLGQWGGQIGGTCFCTLFLVYGGAPVAVNKLQYGKGQDWNLNPRDMANVSKALWSAYERPINWQIVSIDAPASEIEAPILFLSGSKKWEFTEKEMVKLREYIERGGTILAEASDHSEEFTASMERLLKDMYPPQAYPNIRLEALPAEHPVYTVIKHEWKKRPKLRGASNGSRTIFLLSDEYMSADWQANREDSDSFQLAMNLLFYATDLGELEYKFTTLLPTTPPVKVKEGTLTMARVHHSGTEASPQDWEAAARCWDKLGPLVKHLTGQTFKEAKPVTLGKDSLESIRLLHLTGRNTLTLTDDERTALKKFVESGGTILVDPHAGSSAFAKSARKELEDIFGALKPLTADPVLSEGRFQGGVDLSSGVGFSLPARQLLRGRGDKPEGQKLLTAFVKGRPAVLFSEFDLVATGSGIANYKALAYKPESARKILGNLVIYLTVE
jgi:hypothetical protein